MTREEAIECIEAIHVQMFNSGNSKWTKACDMAIEALKENESLAKSVNEASELLRKKRPHGEWIEGSQGYYCSSCDEYDQFYFEHDFCPNCGADMKGD